MLEESRSVRVAAISVAVFALLTVLVTVGWTQSFDDVWNSTMTNLETPSIVALATVFHWLGSFEVALVISVAVGVAFILLRRWRALIAWVVIVGGSQLLSTTTKAWIGRPRPPNGLVVESSAAYPSGHAMVSGAAMGIGLAVLAGVVWPRRRSLYLWLGVIYAVVMAWSRTYLRAHWLTDVVGGLLFGAAVVFAVLTVLGRLEDAQNEEPRSP